MIPPSINVFGTVYDVVACTDLHDVSRGEDVGMIDFTRQEIRIFDPQTGDLSAWKTLMHELIHAIGQELHLDIHINEERHDELDTLAVALVAVLGANQLLRME